jgi:digeranylgeranylglycerophospholipid reductase
MGKRRVDVIVVGAGPAGSCAARWAAEAGARVLMVEKRKRIGEPVQCAEYVPRPLTREVKIPAEAIAQEVTGMVTFMPDGSAKRRSAPGFILHRDLFDQALAANASHAGVSILTGTEAVGWEGGQITVRGPMGEDTIGASVVIGADGPNSTVGSWIGQRNLKVIVALQHTVCLKRPLFETEVYFGKAYPGGYAWLFPKGGLANVGVGVRKELGGIAKESLAAFKSKMGDRIGEVKAVAAGIIPAGRPLPSIDRVKRVLLAGDAAGHTHAVTGGGIPQAVMGGKLAGRAAAAIARGDEQAYGDYFSGWKNAFGALLEKAAAKRVTLETEWHQGDLSALIRRTWIAFQEYYHES